MAGKATQKKPGGDSSGLQENGADGRQLNESSHNPGQKSRLNRRAAIRERCLDCSGFSAKEVRDCPLPDCPLFPYRLPKGKQDPKKRDKAIRVYCREWCMNDQRKEVELCPSNACPLFNYRLTSIKKSHIGQISQAKNSAEGGRPRGAYA